VKFHLPGRLLGGPIRVHWTFPAVLVLLFLMVLDAPPGRRGAMALAAFSAPLALVLHELGHAVAARIFQVRVGGVVLHFFGGLTQLDPGPLAGWKEIPVSAGGPAVNLLLALLALFPAEPFHTFGRINLLFGGLNLVPAWPLDGGRLLRALLALRYPRALATLVSGLLGLALCGGLFFYGLFAWQAWALLSGPFLAVVGLKAMQVEMEAALQASMRGAAFQDGTRGWEEGEEEVREEDPGEGGRKRGKGAKRATLAERLSRFHGSLAEYLERNRRR